VTILEILQLQNLVDPQGIASNAGSELWVWENWGE
jgi:hypothetical protein